jgi:cyclohexa-1,5-dienecarbonyl-CoA hydratase
MLAGFHAMIRQVAAYPVPIAALVEGSCLGGAFELILACHFVFAAPSAVLGCPEIKLGVFPPVLAAIGSHRLGGPLAERLVMTGASIDAAVAERAGRCRRFHSLTLKRIWWNGIARTSPSVGICHSPGARVHASVPVLIAALEAPLG